MISKIARGVYLLILAGMVAAYALSSAKSEAPKPHIDRPTWIIFA
jgi:hypothetical protein